MTANKQRQTDTMTLTNRQLKQNVKSSMNESRNLALLTRTKAESKRGTKEYDTIIKCAEQFEAQYRWHANTLAMLLAIQKDLPIDELIKRRTDIAREILEIAEYLVENQVIKEQRYLELCEFHQNDLKQLS